MQTLHEVFVQESAPIPVAWIWKHMPVLASLEQLQLSRCNAVEAFAPLEACPGLQRLGVAPTAVRSYCV